ncbi:MAG: DNA polymerase III subunit alpha, partial [Pseudorhodoplanes sp.]|nr:DNA polymerase III subunit alpha [Pseudorhodoplanes sp.]
MQYRDTLEPGAAVLLFLSAEAQGDEVRARIQSAERLDQAAEKVQKGLRIFLRDPGPLEGITKRLEATKNGNGRHASGNGQGNGNGNGEGGDVSMILLLAGGSEVEIRLPGRFKVSPQIAGAIKAVPGVVDVESV